MECWGDGSGSVQCCSAIAKQWGFIHTFLANDTKHSTVRHPSQVGAIQWQRYYKDIRGCSPEDLPQIGLYFVRFLQNITSFYIFSLL